ncbi:MAG: N-acetylmuramoyl-L-alanine amidase [Bacteroidetes bacterium]|nr:N-acetylmuramoyl-L-alanine amidase [Bacteroidota bacterium]
MRLKFFFISLLVLSLASVIIFNRGESQINLRKEGSKIDVVIIDAGHGGKDPGSTSITKIPEKNYNLLIAKYLAEMLRKNYSDMEVYMTRDDDTFIDLKERGRIANSKKGKLFVSVHCNSKLPEESDKSGFEVYVMDAVKSNDAVKITQGENLLLRDNMDSTRGKTAFQNDFILSSMYSNAYRRYSERFASILQTELTKTTQLENRGIKEEQFVVNYTSSMPSVLVECGFLSNTKDEAYLRSKDGQYDIARSIYKAIRYFKMDYEWENSY